MARKTRRSTGSKRKGGLNRYIVPAAVGVAALVGIAYVWALPPGGGNGGNTGQSYNCVAGNCVTVLSGGQYATLAECQAACGTSGTVNPTLQINGGASATIAASDCYTITGDGYSNLSNQTNPQLIFAGPFSGALGLAGTPSGVIVTVGITGIGTPGLKICNGTTRPDPFAVLFTLPAGTYTLYAADGPTGKVSNSVTLTVGA